MTYEVAIGSRVRRVTVTRDGSAWLVSLDGAAARRFEGRSIGAAEWMLRPEGGAWQAVGVHLRGTRATTQVEGHGLNLDVRDARAWRGPASGRTGHGEVRTPMPGVVTRVPVAVGDDVREGSVVVVVEAMKMENELRAPVGGRVSAVHAATGQAVEGGAILVVVDPR
jgi:biotin carboxyl carrier protein